MRCWPSQTSLRCRDVFYFDLIEHQFVGADFRKVRRHASPASHPRSAAATIGDCGPCRSRPRARPRENRRWRTLAAPRDIPAPGIAPARTIAAPAAAASASPPCRAAISRSRSSASRCASSEPSRCSAATMSSIRSWANQPSIVAAASRRPGPRSRRSQNHRSAAFISPELRAGRAPWSGPRARPASLPDGTTASANRAWIASGPFMVWPVKPK